MRTTILAALATLFLVSGALQAQAPPDFSGSWTLSESTGGPQGAARAGGGGPPAGGQGAMRGGGTRGGGMGAMMGGFGQSATITQSGTTLTVVRTTPRGEIRSVYNLDGSESRNQVGMGMGGNQMELVSRASWVDGKLVIVTPVNMQGNSIETRMSLSLDDAGRLVVESSRSGGPGGGGTQRAVYTRE